MAAPKCYTTYLKRKNVWQTVIHVATPSKAEADRCAALITQLDEGASVRIHVSDGFTTVKTAGVTYRYPRTLYLVRRFIANEPTETAARTTVARINRKLAELQIV